MVSASASDNIVTCHDVLSDHPASIDTSMPVKRLRNSIFPNVAPFLTFIAPDEQYEDGEEPPEELVVNYTVAYGTSKTVLECIQRFGAKVIEVVEVTMN